MIDKTKTPPETVAHWDQVPRTNPVTSLPWEKEAPSTYLIELIESGQVDTGPVLDIGTGSGNNAVFLAGKGYSCHAVDIPPTAIDIAKEKAAKAGVTCDFGVRDVLDLAFDNVFNLVSIGDAFIISPQINGRYALRRSTGLETGREVSTQLL